MKKMFFAYGFVIPVIVVILDQWSKIAVLRSFDVPLNICEIGFARGAYQHNILPFLDFSLLCNQGISWGLLQGDSSIKRWGLTIFAFAMCIVLLYSLTRVKDRLNRPSRILSMSAKSTFSACFISDMCSILPIVPLHAASSGFYWPDF